MKKDVPEKHVFWEKGYEYLRTSRDVRPRRPDGAIFKGNLEAEAQKAHHLGQHLEPKPGETDILTQNYL